MKMTEAGNALVKIAKAVEKNQPVSVCVCVCVCVRVRMCVRVCVRACVSLTVLTNSIKYAATSLFF